MEPAGGSKAPLLVANPSDADVSQEIYLGVVKSYNDRRGFGFLACTETADKFGRDVYMPKAEATMAALQAVGVEREIGASMVAGGNVSAAAAQAAVAAAPRGAAAAKAAAAAMAASEKERAEGEKAPPAPRLAEEDLVIFRVRLSIEGYPQAVCVQRLRKLAGKVLRPPEVTGAGSLVSDQAAEVNGNKEVPFALTACGQLRLAAGDEVTFCLPQAAKGVDGAGESALASSGVAQAMMISLSSSERANGSVLGCFTLDLPRTRAGDEVVIQRPNLLLTCHAFGDKLILAGLPSDLDESELMRFFSKQGAAGTIVAHARTCSFASVSFQSTADVARFLGRTAHAFADDKDTLIARLLPLAPGTESATLPALPCPTLSHSESAGEELESGSLLVMWSPLVLAVAYSVELRPANSAGRWATVDVASRRLGSGGNRFDSNCSSCRVTGLQLNNAYEARVSYFTECGTCSEASEASEPLLPAAGPGAPRPPEASTVPASSASPALLGQTGLGAAEGFSSASNGVPAPFPAPAGGGLPPQMMPGFPPAPPNWPAWPPADPYGLPPLPPPMPVHDPAAAAAAAGYGLPPPGHPPAWRSPSGLVVPPPAAPELSPGDEFGFAVSVQWPAVLQAAAYVVELREAGTMAFERFVRSAPEATLGTLVELRVGGLRPGPPPGRVYMAQVRTVGADGFESMPSPPGWSPPLPSVEGGGVVAAGAVETAFLSTAGTPPDAAAPISSLSADAVPWQPAADEEWVPPPWLTASPSEPFSSPMSVPGAASPLTGTPDRAPAWGVIGVPPPPPAGPPALGGTVSAARTDEADAKGSAAQAECLILD